MRRYLVLGRPRRTVRVLHLTEVACKLFELASQLIDLTALIDDHLIQFGKRLLCMHQDAFDVGQALFGRLGQANPLVAISAGWKHSIFKTVTSNSLDYNRAVRQMFADQASSNAAGAMNRWMFSRAS